MITQHKMKITLLLFFFLFVFQGTSQPRPFEKKYVDSILPLLGKMRADTTKVETLNTLSAMYTNVDPLQANKFANEAIELAKQINDQEGLVAALGRSAFTYAITSEWPKSISRVNEALQYADKIDGRRRIYFYDIMIINNATKGDFNACLEWVHKILNESAFTALNEMEAWPSNMLTTITYENLNRLDSANYYGKYLMNCITKYSKIAEDLTSNSYMVLGRIAVKEKKFEEAKLFFKRSGDNVRIAALYDILGFHDSANVYAIKGLNDAQPRKNHASIQEASQILATNLEHSNPVEAIKYLKIYTASKDSQYNVQKLYQVEQMNLIAQKNGYEKEKLISTNKNKIFILILFGVITIFLLVTLLVWRNNRLQQKANQKLERAYGELKSTQAQLIQSVKMASLGELTAGIAHEIQNPLNFVNNFSEVSLEMIQEVKSEKLKMNSERDEALEYELLNDIAANLEKINHHGKRADAIIKGMMQHSRSSSGVKEPTDINALADEYLRLAYHGLRAKDKSFNATMVTEYDASIGAINIIPQDIGRVILNLITNAFYVVDEKKKQIGEGYEPTVTVSTIKNEDTVEIRVKDNGSGIPAKILDKIFQPFFTTKPTGQGTGLGLSLSYDIVKAHGGELKVETKKGEGSEFIIQLPII